MGWKAEGNVILGGNKDIKSDYHLQYYFSLFQGSHLETQSKPLFQAFPCREHIGLETSPKPAHPTDKARPRLVKYPKVTEMPAALCLNPAHCLGAAGCGSSSVLIAKAQHIS